MTIFDLQSAKKTFPVALVVSRFNEDVTNRLCEGALARLKELDFTKDQITVIWVPGAVEIPLIAQMLARKKKYSAIICLGAVIRGETSHYDYVCDQASQGCQRVGLEHDIPVIFGVLTTESDEQALARAGGGHSHKGIESVDAAVEMVAVLEEMAGL